MIPPLHDDAPDNPHAVRDVTAPGGGQAAGLVYGDMIQQRFAGRYRLLRDATIDLAPLPGDLHLIDPTNPDNPVARFQGRTELIKKIDTFIDRCVHQRRGGYLLVEAEAGMGKSALAAYLAFTRGWPAHFTRLADGTNPDTARRNLAAQLIARWKLHDATRDGILPDDAGTTRWLHGRLCDAARTRDQHAKEKNTPEEPVVVLIDGLDEATPAAAGELPLGLPPSLPSGTVIVATTRPRIIHIPSGAQSIERIDVESTANRRDLLDYLTAVTASDSYLVDALRDSHMPIDQFCHTLLERSGGVWIYALSVLDQIRDHGRSPTNVDQLPDGLAGYYADNLGRWQDELGVEQWANIGLPILATLAALLEPQTSAQIAAWAEVPPTRARDLLRGMFKPFLAVHRGGDPDLYQLRHQSLRDFCTGTALENSHDDRFRELSYDLSVATREAHQRITTALTPSAPVNQRDWASTSHYTHTYLAEHAAKAGYLDELVNDPGFLLSCQPADILRHRRHLQTADGVAAVNAYEKALRDIDAHPEDPPAWWLHIWAHKTLAATLAHNAAQCSPRPWTIQSAMWIDIPRRALTVNALAPVPLPDGRILLASAGNDRAVRLWDPTTGKPEGPPLTGHTGPVTTLTTIPLPNRHALLATGSWDHTVRLWDPITGKPEGPPLTGHTGWVRTLTTVPLPDGRTLLASAGNDRAVRLWDPTTGKPEGPPLTGHTDWVLALAAVPLDGITLLATGSWDHTVRLWDPTTGKPEGPPLTGHTGPVNALVTVPLPDGRLLLASAGNDRAVRLWDPTTGKPEGPPLTGHRNWVRAMTLIHLPNHRVVLATTSWDHTVRLWDPTVDEPTTPLVINHTGWIRALTAVPLPDHRTLLATSSWDHTVRLWDPETGELEEPPLTGHTSTVTTLSTITLPNHRTLLVTADDNQTIIAWSPAAT